MLLLTGHGVRLATNWRREALHLEWPVASGWDTGRNTMCADLSRNTNGFVTWGVIWPLGVEAMFIRYPTRCALRN